MQYAYEDRIAELRAKVDRTTSRQLLDQEQFDQKLDQIMRRQTALESRATALGAIPPDVTGSIRPPARGAAAIRRRRHAGNAETVADQRHRDLRGAARSRSAAGIARAGRRQRRNRTNSPRSRASTTCWSGCRPRSTRSSAARWRRSARSRKAWNRACAGCAASFSDLGLDMAQLEAAAPRARRSAVPSCRSS